MKGAKFLGREQAFGVHCLQLEPAEIIVSAFQVCGAYRPSDDAFQQRNVFVEDLVLERLGSGRNEYPSAIDEGRQQVRERLARSCTRFDDDVALLFEGRMYSLGHPDLRRSEFVIRQPLLQVRRRVRKTRASPGAVYTGHRFSNRSASWDSTRSRLIAVSFEGAARIGILEMDGVRVQESPEELKAMLNGLADEFAQKYKDEPLGEIPTVKKIRAIFHRAGLDPTRYRPSSESLLRRAVKGKGLYFINSVVDLVNYFSLKMLCPMGLYDAARIKPPITWRVGQEGESYEGIGRDRLNLAHFPLLVDQEGPFGSPISDSMRTRVTEDMHEHSVDYVCAAGTNIPIDEFSKHDDPFQRRDSSSFHSNMITIPASLLRQIYDHTEASYPNECCGLMIGTMGERQDGSCISYLQEPE